jgi:hypothetical protein
MSTLLEVKNLKVHFPVKHGMLSRVREFRVFKLRQERNLCRKFPRLRKAPWERHLLKIISREYARSRLLGMNAGQISLNRRLHAGLPPESAQRAGTLQDASCQPRAAA